MMRLRSRGWWRTASGKHHHLPLAAGEGKDVARGKVRDAEALHHFHRAGELFVGDAHGEAVHLAEQHDFERGQRGIDDGVLRHVADGFAPGHVVGMAEGFVLVADDAFMRDFGKDGFHQRGFARAVWPQHGVAFAGVQFERDVVGNAELPAARR